MRVRVVARALPLMLGVHVWRVRTYSPQLLPAAHALGALMLTLCPCATGGVAIQAPNSAFGRATAGLWHLPGALQGMYEGLTESGWSDHSLVAAAIMAAVASGLVAIALLDCCVAGGFKLHLE